MGPSDNQNRFDFGENHQNVDIFDEKFENFEKSQKQFEIVREFGSGRPRKNDHDLLIESTVF